MNEIARSYLQLVEHDQAASNAEAQKNAAAPAMPYDSGLLDAYSQAVTSVVRRASASPCLPQRQPGCFRSYSSMGMSNVRIWASSAASALWAGAPCAITS